AGYRLLDGGVDHPLEWTAQLVGPAGRYDGLTCPGACCGVTVAAQQQIGLEERCVLILFRRPHPDEFLDRRRASSKTVRQTGRVPGEVHLREQRHLDRRVGSARERTVPAGVRAERVQRQELVTGPVRLGCRLLVPREQGREVRFKRRPEVAIPFVARVTHQACLYEVDR